MVHQTTNNFLALFFFPEITSEPVVDCMERFSTSSNARLSNLAKVFLQVKDFAYKINLNSKAKWNLLIWLPMGDRSLSVDHKAY